MNPTQHEEKVTQLLTKGYAHVDLASEPLVKKIIPDFLDMTAIKPFGSFTFGFPTRRDPDTGLIYRGGKDGVVHGGDKKWFFHYKPILWDLLEEHGTDFSAWEPMLRHCDELWTLCRAAIKPFAEQLQRQRPDLVVPPFCTNRTHQHDVLRVLAYLEARPDIDPIDGAKDIFARSHRDRNGLTLAISESTGGLEGAPGDASKIYTDGFTSVGSRPGQALIFAGAKLQDLNGGGEKFPALVHRVNKNTEPYSARVLRCSVVFFAHPEGTNSMKMSTHYGK